MLRKLILFKQQWILRSQTQRLSFFGKKKNKKQKVVSLQETYRCVTMDDMPIPSGDWTEHHAKRNRKYNIVLSIGIISLIGSILFLKESVFFNAFPPPYPFKEEDKNCNCECVNTP